MPRRTRLIALFSISLILSTAPSIRADAKSIKAVDAVGLGLNGSGVKIAVVEAAAGLPQLSDTVPANPTMPATGGAAGANGKITNANNAFLPGGTTPAQSDHATMVNGIIMNLGGAGMAPNAIDFALPTSNNVDEIQATQSLIRSDAGPNAPIINESFSYGGTSNGNDDETAWQDWAALTNPAFIIHDKLFVVAGNETPAGTRNTPWDNYNGITVGATGGAGYQYYATYNLSDRAQVPGIGSAVVAGAVRFKCDIVAPGGGPGSDGTTALMRNGVLVGGANDNFAGGATNGDGLNDNPNFAGTSFAAPHVTAAAAMLTQEASIKGFGTIDHDAMKAIILNGASKSVYDSAGNGWAAFGANGTKPTPGGGANTPVNIGWSDQLGTGLLDVGQSKLILDAGKQAPGPVNLIGWDFNSMVTTGNSKDYMVSSPKLGLNTVTATLAWDRRIQLNDTNGNQLWDPGETFTTGTAAAGGNPAVPSTPLNDLDLRIIDVTAGNILMYQSDSAYDSIEHVNWTVPFANRFDTFDIEPYYFQQLATDGLATPYGLAWTVTVPEPATAALLGLFAASLLVRRHRHGA